MEPILSVRQAIRACLSPAINPAASPELVDAVIDSILSLWPAAGVNGSTSVDRAAALQHGLRSLSLRAAYEQFELPDQMHNAPAHRAKFEATLNAWETIVGDGTPHSGPSIGDIRDEHLRAFVDGFLIGHAPFSTNVAIGYVRQILRKCGPAGYRAPNGRGIIDRVPHVRKLRVPEKMPRIVPFRNLGPLYTACQVAEWPTAPGLPPSLWWRSMLALSFTYGFRSGDLLGIKEDGGLKWSAIQPPGDCPIDGVEVPHELGWIVFEPRKTRKHKGNLVLPITAVVKQHLDALPRLDDVVLPLPRCFWKFHEQRLLIHKAAGLALQKDERGREAPFNLQQLRRSARTYWGRVSPEIARYIGGWSARGVDVVFYSQILAAMLERDGRGERVLDRFTYPDEFLKGPPASDRVERPCRPKISDWEWGPGFASHKGIPLSLSPRHLTILRTIVQAGRPVTMAQLAGSAFWDSPLIDPRTIKSTISALRKRLAELFDLPPGQKAIICRNSGLQRGYCLARFFREGSSHVAPNDGTLKESTQP